MFALSFLLLAATAFANTASPYTAIVERNTFGLKPPPPPPTVEPPAAPPSKIKLQGITTILGRKQVLFKTQVQAKPPDYPQPREVSFVVAEGDREGDITVKSIDVAAETVTFDNNGKVETLNLKDDSDKPAVGAAPVAPGAGATPGVLPAPRLPGAPRAVPGVNPTPANPAAANPAGTTSVSTFGGTGTPGDASVSTFGGSGAAAATPVIPGRALRSVPSATSSGGQTPQRDLTPDEAAAMLELNRKLHEGRGLPFPPPRNPLPQ